jgi:predicted metal-dependent HD superfamily phosphohydrolase
MWRASLATTSNMNTTSTCTELRLRSEEIARRYSADAGFRAHLADELLGRYAEAGRHYHGAAHLEYMIDKKEKTRK